jgi:uncharacterized membrane protein YgcG
MNRVKLSHQTVDIVRCEECSHKMVNLDKHELYSGDLAKLKNEGVRVSNPDTEKAICIHCEEPDGFFSNWFDSDDNDDSGFFSGIALGGLSSIGSSSSGSSGGFGGGFSGFGGGGFSGGGASGSF